MKQWAQLLEDFRELPARIEPLPTFLEFAGCKRKEEVHSDVLAFYLDPNKPHGLGTLFLDALVRALEIPNPPERGTWVDVSVEREKSTEKGSRIDILIESNSHVIVIENKIFAGVNNPFDDYKSFAETLEPQGRHVHVVLLTLTSNEAKDRWKFLWPATHPQLIGQIRELLGEYVAEADTRYLTLMLDLLNTLDHLQGGIAMDPCFRKFLEKNLDDVEALLQECYQFKIRELREMAKGLRDSVGDGTAFPTVTKVQTRTPNLGSPHAQNSSLVYEVQYFFKRQEFENNVRAIVSPSGWEIRVGQAGQQLKELLDRTQTECEPLEKGRQSYRVTRFGHDEGLPCVAQAVKCLIERLAAEQN